MPCEVRYVTFKSQHFSICLVLMPHALCLMHNSWYYIRGMKGKWVAFSVWLSTFWQQSRAISETGWLPSLPQFCSNEGAVLLKQTGSLEMYLNYLLNPGSLSYLPTNGPVVRHSTLQCHSSLQLQRDEQVRLLHVGKVTTHTLVAYRSGLRAQFGWSAVTLCVTMLKPRRTMGVHFSVADINTSTT